MLKNHLHRLYDTIISRGDVIIEVLTFDIQSGHRGFIEGRLKFYDGSLLEFDEVLTLPGKEITKLRYTYHYQNSVGMLIFRYDNAPHYPHLPTHPHHKHIGDIVEPAAAPDLSDVLHEIDRLIYEVNE